MRILGNILVAIVGAVLLILMQGNLWMIVMVMVGAAVLTGFGLGLREIYRQDVRKGDDDEM